MYMQRERWYFVYIIYTSLLQLHGPCGICSGHGWWRLGKGLGGRRIGFWCRFLLGPGFDCGEFGQFGGEGWKAILTCDTLEGGDKLSSSISSISARLQKDKQHALHRENMPLTWYLFHRWTTFAVTPKAWSALLCKTVLAQMHGETLVITDVFYGICLEIRASTTCTLKWWTPKSLDLQSWWFQ